MSAQTMVTEATALRRYRGTWENALARLPDCNCIADSQHHIRRLASSSTANKASAMLLWPRSGSTQEACVYRMGQLFS